MNAPATKPAPIGQMRDRVELLSRTATANNYGERVPSAWSRYAAVWAKVDELGGGEQPQAGRQVGVKNYRVTIRWRADVLATHALRFGGAVLQIDDARDPDGRRRVLELTCVQSKEA